MTTDAAFVSVVASATVAGGSLLISMWSTVSSRRHTGRARVLDRRDDAYVSLIATFDLESPRDAVIDAKIVVYATKEVRDLYYEWLDSLSVGRPRRTELENNIRNRVRYELQAIKGRDIPLRT